MPCCDRRKFMRTAAGGIMAAGIPSWIGRGEAEVLRSQRSHSSSPQATDLNRHNSRVAIVPCKDYGIEVYFALKRSFDLLGGINRLVKNKTVTVKINMTGTSFRPLFGRPVGDSYMTHPVTAMALAQLSFEGGAKRVRFVESTNSWMKLEHSLVLAGWDINAFLAIGKNVDFENTRNLGLGTRYAHIDVPGNGYMFSSFYFNHSYEDTDVFISLCKLKNHVTAGVTLSMKNLFGITPNSLYGSEAGSEKARKGRGPLHNPGSYDHIVLPGLKPRKQKRDNPGHVVPRIIADINAARPIDIAVIDGITGMSGGEGPWVRPDHTIQLTTPGVLIVGCNPVSTDAVGMAVMGYEHPRAELGEEPFEHCDNHLVLAEQSGVGSADLERIEVMGQSIKQSRYPYGEWKPEHDGMTGATRPALR